MPRCTSYTEILSLLKQKFRLDVKIIAFSVFIIAGIWGCKKGRQIRVYSHVGCCLPAGRVYGAV